MQLATQLDKLGTENAFAVSALAAEWQAQGNRIYPFHLGDINLLPPPAIIDRIVPAIQAGKNVYCPGAGIPLLRAQIAAHFGRQRGVEYAAENVAVQPGGKPVIGKFLQAVMNPGEEVLYPVPGFPIYESQIRYQGGVPVPYHYRASGGDFVLDADEIRAAITGNTRALIFNNYHNPTGAAATDAELDAIAALITEHNLWLLNDDAYFLIRYGDTPARSLLPRDGIKERAINLFTFSKQFAMTGWRLGAAIGPAAAINAIARMNTNVESCTTHFMQQAVGEALADGAGDDVPILPELQTRRDTLVAGLNAIDGIDVAAPPSAFYVYADLTAILQRKGADSIDNLMRRALEQTGVSFCTGAHFGAGDSTTYARFAYSGITPDDITTATTLLKQYFETNTL